MAQVRVMDTNRKFNPLNEDIKTLYNRACELARQTWIQIRDLPEPDRAFIRDALATRFAEARPERVLVALDALRRCQLELGRVPSAGRYEDFRKQRPDLDLRSAKFISNSFGGSWRNAIAAFLGEPLPNVLRKRLTSGVSLYSDEDLIDFTQEFIELHVVEWIDGQPTLTCPLDELTGARRTIRCLSQRGFRAYARHQENVLRRRFPSLEMICSRFDGWENAVAAACKRLASGELRVVAIEMLTTRDARRAQIVSLLVKCASELGEVPTPAEFDQWLRSTAERRDVIDRKAANAWIALRTSNDAIRSFKTWNQALVSAGLIGQQFAQPGRIYATPEHRFSTDELLQAIRDARQEVTGKLNDRAFEGWRSAKLDLDDSRPIPSGRTIRHRFGSLAAALAAADLEVIS